MLKRKYLKNIGTGKAYCRSVGKEVKMDYQQEFPQKIRLKL